MSERWEGDNETILGYCFYCKDPVREGEGHIYINGDYFHFDKLDPLKNCYFPEDKEE